MIRIICTSNVLVSYLCSLLGREEIDFFPVSFQLQRFEENFYVNFVTSALASLFSSTAVSQVYVSMSVGCIKVKKPLKWELNEFHNSKWLRVHSVLSLIGLLVWGEFCMSVSCLEALVFDLVVQKYLLPSERGSDVTRSLHNLCWSKLKFKSGVLLVYLDQDRLQPEFQNWSEYIQEFSLNKGNKVPLWLNLGGSRRTIYLWICP